MKRHLMLFSDALVETATENPANPAPTQVPVRPLGRWRFLVEDLSSNWRLEATDVEPGMIGERLELLSVIRGLESIEGRSRVTLITPSRYVSQGLRFGLPQWRQDNWQWELHGVMTDIRNADLWRRIDQALQYHELQSRYWRMDRANVSAPKPHFSGRRNRGERRNSETAEDAGRRAANRWLDWLARPVRTRGEQNLPEKTESPRSVALV